MSIQSYFEKPGRNRAEQNECGVKFEFLSLRDFKYGFEHSFKFDNNTSFLTCNQLSRKLFERQLQFCTSQNTEKSYKGFHYN